MVHAPLVCPDCRETVPPGRLSCPHCGTVLAAVAGRAWGAGPAPSAAEDGPPPVARSVADVLSASAVSAPSDPGDSANPEEPVGSGADAPGDVPAAGTVAGDEPRLPSVLHEVGEDPASTLADDDDGTADAIAAPPSTWLSPAPQERLPAAPLLPTQDHQPPVTPAYLPRPGLGTVATQAAVTGEQGVAPPPGAWLPPATPAPSAPPPASYGSPAIAAAAPVLPVASAPAPFQARTWESRPGGTPAGSATDPSGPDAGARTEPAGPAGSAGLAVAARRLFTIEGVSDAANVVVLAGSMAVAIAFLVPWSRVMIGAGSSGSYTDSWGLAGPGHAWVFLAALVTFGLAAMPNRVPAWLRTGVLGLLVGALVLGLAWPYALGPLGAGPGVVLVVVAGLMLVGAGVTSVAASRHRTQPSAV